MRYLGTLIIAQDDTMEFEYKDYVLRKKLSEITGHYVSTSFIARITNISRRSIYARLNGESQFSGREISRLAMFFKPYGITKEDIIAWIKEGYGGTNSPDGAPKEGPRSCG